MICHPLLRFVLLKVKKRLFVCLFVFFIVNFVVKGATSRYFECFFFPFFRRRKVPLNIVGTRK